jgi:hypothetical protein
MGKHDESRGLMDSLVDLSFLDKSKISSIQALNCGGENTDRIKQGLIASGYILSAIGLVLSFTPWEAPI